MSEKVGNALMLLKSRDPGHDMAYHEAIDTLDREICQLRMEVPRKLAERRLRVQDTLRDLLEVAEEMYPCLRYPSDEDAIKWKAAIEAAKKEKA